MRERNHLAAQMDGLRTLEGEVGDTLELIALAEADNDATMVDEGVAALRALAEPRRHGSACPR